MASRVAPIAPDSALRSRVSTLPRNSSGLRSGLQPQGLRLTPQRGRAEARARRQPLDRVGEARDQRVADVLARQEPGEGDALGQ